MADIARKQNATNVANTHKRRNTFSSTVKIDDIRSLDLDECIVGDENFKDKREKVLNKFIVKSFLKNCYSALTNTNNKKKESTVSSPSRRMTVQPKFKQFENFKLLMSEGPQAIQEEKDEEKVIPKNTIQSESHQVIKEVSKIDITIKGDQFKTIEEMKEQIEENSNRRKEPSAGKPTHQRTISKNISYEKIVKLKEGSGKKKKKLNNVLCRLTKQTESSERRNKMGQSDSFTKLVHPYDNIPSHTFYNPYSNRKSVGKKKGSVSKSAEKSKSPRRNQAELNNIIKLSKRVHEVNKQKGIYMTKISKGQSKIDGNAEIIINEQASIIDEYHKSLKEAVDKNEKLEKEVEFLKKELAQFNDRSNEPIPKITIMDSLKNKPVLISYKTPGKHKKNANSFAHN